MENKTAGDSTLQEAKAYEIFVESRTSLRLLRYLAVYIKAPLGPKYNGKISYINRLTNKISKEEKLQETQQ